VPLGHSLLLSWCFNHHVALVFSMYHFESVNNIVFMSIKYVEFCANKTQFAGSFTFLLPFEEKCCWKSTNTVGSLMIILHQFQHVSTGFDATKKVILTEDKERLGQSKKFEEVEENLRKWKLHSIKTRIKSKKNLQNH